MRPTPNIASLACAVAAALLAGPPPALAQRAPAPPLAAPVARAVEEPAVEASAAEARAAEPLAREAPAAQAPAVRAPAATDQGRPSASEQELDRVLVLGYRLNRYQGEAEFDSLFIDALPRGNGDLSTLLRIHPSVQFDEGASSSLAPGEIRPAEIAINGAPFYQNAFRIDGVNFTNDLDPASNGSPNSYADVPSATQGLALDTSIVERVTVYDSNVPASFGRFNGGVVDAQTRRAGERLSGSLAVRTTRSAWTEYNVEAGDRAAFELSTDEDAQPEFEKWDVRGRLEGRTRGGLGLLGTVSLVRSVIPLRAYDDGFDSAADAGSKDQVRQNLNLGLRADWTAPGGLGLDASAFYAPTDERYFRENARASFYDIRSGGPVLNLGADHALGAHTLGARLSYSDLDSARRSDADYFRRWDWSPEKNWGDPDRSNPSSIEGAWGDIDQRQREIGLRLTWRREALRWGSVSHALSAGVDVQNRYAEYARLNAHIVDRTVAATTTCTAADGTVDTVACSSSPTLRTGRGQYFRFRDVYEAGRFEVRANDVAVFVEDDMRWGRVQVRAGLRAEYDDVMRKRTLSPRLAFAWDVLGDDRLRATAGVNRYHGRTFFSNALREGRDALRVTYRRGASLLYGPGERAASLNRFVELEIPYADELALGADIRLWGMNVAAKWVGREGRDEILRRLVPNTDPRYASRVFEYTNGGRTSSDTYTFNIAPVRPWEWGATRHHWFLAADWTDVRRNYNTYESSLDPALAETVVLYEGERVRFDELPAGNFNRPWAVRLATRSDLPRWGLTLSNFLRYRAGYRDVVFQGQRTEGNETLDAYAAEDLDPTWTLDTSLEWERTLREAFTVFSRLEINNITNRVNAQRVGASGVVFEPGRQYWLELGLRF